MSNNTYTSQIGLNPRYKTDKEIAAESARKTETVAQAMNRIRQETPSYGHGAIVHGHLHGAIAIGHPHGVIVHGHPHGVIVHGHPHGAIAIGHPHGAIAIGHPHGVIVNGHLHGASVNSNGIMLIRR
jgi:hypothetical protein